MTEQTFACAPLVSALRAQIDLSTSIRSISMPRSIEVVKSNPFYNLSGRRSTFPDRAHAFVLPTASDFFLPPSYLLSPFLRSIVTLHSSATRLKYATHPRNLVSIILTNEMAQSYFRYVLFPFHFVHESCSGFRSCMAEVVMCSVTALERRDVNLASQPLHYGIGYRPLLPVWLRSKTLSDRRAFEDI